MTADPRALAATLLASHAGLREASDTAWGATVHALPTPTDDAALPRVEVALREAERDTRPDPAGDLALLSVLGRGGMGEVWLAEQRSLERTVAAKLPLESGSGEANALVSEARISGRLEHPHIVPVHSVGRMADGRPILVMKRVQGAPLDVLAADPSHPAWTDLLRRHGDRETAILETLMRVADALAFAHSRGVVHRDVKPENVMVGAFGEVYLMDWGCAVPMAASPRPAFAGTPAFMAPEMVDHELGPLDARTDVYLLGATLHAALTGRPRHEGATFEAVVWRALESAPIDYGDTLAAELAAIGNRATAREPGDRYPSAAEFRDELGRAIDLRAMRALATRIADRAGLEDGPGAPAPDARRLDEARYALAPLVAELPQHLPFRALLDRVLRAIVARALSDRRLPAAEEALAALSEPDRELAEGVARLRSELEEARRLAEVGSEELRQRDVRPGLKGVVALVAFMAVNSVMLVGTLTAKEEPAMKELVVTDMVSLALVTLAAAAFRRSLTANRRGKSTMAGAYLVIVGMTAYDVLSAYLGQTAREAAPFTLLAAAAGFAALTLFLDMPRRARWATGLCAAIHVVQAFWSGASPNVATTFMSISVVETLLTAAVIVFEMARERHESAPAA